MTDETPGINQSKLITEFHNRYKLDTVFDPVRKCVVHTANEKFSEVSSDWLGTWEEVRVIGRGGFGSVWLEKELVTGRQRAVKRMPRDKGREVDLPRELKALIEVRKCPDSFIQFFGWYENTRHIFIAMEYIEEGDLGQYLKTNGRQNEEGTKEITRQLVVGLEFLHRENICHRDLKPENVLMASTSPVRIKLTDFGISKSTINTNLRTRIGTEAYMAPEILGALPPNLNLGAVYTNAVDMWALGCLVHKIYTLETPFLERLSTTTLFSETGIATGVYERSTDMELLYNFCNGDIELPIDLLEELGVSDRGIQFIKELLVAHPKSRISAKGAMKSRWLLGLPVDEHEIIRSQFSKLGVHLNLRVTEGFFKQWEQLRKAGISGSPLLPMAKGPEVLVCADRLKELCGLGISELPTLMVKSPSTLIHAAASKGYVMAVGIMIYLIRTNKEGVDFRTNGWTALQLAARGGHIDVVNLLLEKGAKVNANPCTEQGRTALQAAAQGGHLELVRLLLDKKADINAKPSYNAGRGALQAASQSGSLEVANLLLERGAKVNTPPCMIQGRTALQAAAEKGQLELVRLLLEKGAKVDAEASDIGGRTAIQAAAENGHLEIARLLLERGADVNAEPCNIEGRTALQAAAENGHLDMVRILLEMGADPDAEPCSEEGVTALSAAIKGGYSEIEEVLRAAGAELCND